MRRKVLYFIILAIGTISVSGQTTDRCRLTLGIGGGAGIASHRDLGTSPRVYDGLAARHSIDFGVDYKKWHWDGYLTISGGIYADDLMPLTKASFSKYGFAFESGIAARKELWADKSDAWHFDLGASLGSYTVINVASRFMNASFSLGSFWEPAVVARMEYTMPNMESMAVLPGWFSAHLEMRLSPFGIAYRPGYAYLDNYTADREESKYILSSYKGSLTWLPLLAFDTGVHFNLRSGNRIGISYLWHWRSTLNSGAWRYDEAAHFVNVEFLILLRR